MKEKYMKPEMRPEMVIIDLPGDVLTSSTEIVPDVANVSNVSLFDNNSGQ